MGKAARLVARRHRTATPIRLDLSLTDKPMESFVRPLGFRSTVYPWTLDDESVAEAHSAYLLQRIPGPDRIRFMEELWRVLVLEGKATMLVPYWSSPRSIQDPLAAWPPLCEQSFLYFNKSFREANQIPPMACDFDFVYGYTLDPETQARGDDVRPFWIKHYANTVLDLQVVLTKRV
jgi:hypothetical protein